MRFAVVALTAAALSGTPAHAEKRLFVLAGQADGYGIDHCLATGAACGHVVANSYCRSHHFAKAESVRNVGRDDITGPITDDSGGACDGGYCAHFIAIECSR
jgi:hypothetical protein